MKNHYLYLMFIFMMILGILVCFPGCGDDCKADSNGKCTVQRGSLTRWPIGRNK